MIDLSKLTMGHRKSPTTVSNVRYLGTQLYDILPVYRTGINIIQHVNNLCHRLQQLTVRTEYVVRILHIVPFVRS